MDRQDEQNAKILETIDKMEDYMDAPQRKQEDVAMIQEKMLAFGKQMEESWAAVKEEMMKEFPIIREHEEQKAKKAAEEAAKKVANN